MRRRCEVKEEVEEEAEGKAEGEESQKTQPGAVDR